MRRLAGPLGFLSLTRLILNTGYRLVYPFLPVIARGLDVSVSRAGLLVSARNLAGVATPGVVTAVRPGRNARRLVTLSLALFALGAAITSATGVFWGAFVGFVLMGMGKPSFDVGAMTYLADRTPYESRARVMSVLELTWAGGLLVGAPAVGWLIDRAGWEAPFWVIAGLSAAALLLASRMLEGTAGPDRDSGGKIDLDSSARVLLVVFVLFSLAAEVVFVALGSWLELEFDLEVVQLGLFAAVLGFSELGGELTTLAFADRVGKRNAISAGIVLAICGFLLIAVAGSTLPGALAAAALAFFGFEVTIVSALPFASEVLPSARSRYLGFIQAAMATARAIGAAVGNPLFDAFGIAANAGVAAVLNLASLFLLLSLIKEHGAH